MESLGSVSLSPSSNAVVSRGNGSRSLLPFTQSNLRRRICITLLPASTKPANENSLLWSTTFSPISASSSLSQESVQVDLEESGSHTQIIATDETSTSTTVRVRFLLQKECCFGEQFLLVGDDSVLGLWDPEIGVPLEWSDGHVWAAELDIPIGRTIKYKFILKGIDGKMLWQPDPDRVLETREASKTIVVLEDWQDPHFQKIVEEEEEEEQATQIVVKEDQMVAEDLKPVTVSDLQIVTAQMPPKEELSVGVEDPSLLIVEENSTREESRTVINDVMEEIPTDSVVKEEDSVANEDSANSSVHIVESKVAPDLETESVSISVDPPFPADHKTETVAAASLENPIPVIADDINHYHQEHHHHLGENTTSHSKEEPLSPPSNNVDDLNDIDSVSSAMSSTTIDIDGSLVPHESVPVLIPDLSPVPESISDTHASSEGESSGNVAFDNNNKSPTSQENGTVMEYNKAVTIELHKEEGVGQQMAAGSASEETRCCGQSRPRGGKDCVLESDVQWVQKLLSNLGLL